MDREQDAFALLSDEVLQYEVLRRVLDDAVPPENLWQAARLARVCKRFEALVWPCVHTLCATTQMENAALAKLSHLKTLELGRNKLISDAGLAHVPLLTTLKLGENETISDAGLAHVPRLTTLDLGRNETISDAGLAHVPLLTTLLLSWKSNDISDAGIAHVPQLTTLDLGGNNTISNAGLTYVPRLTELKLGENKTIGGAKVAQLKHLRIVKK